MKIKVLIITLVILLISCSHTHQVSTQDEMNHAFEDEVVEIQMIWGNTLHAKNVQIQADSAHWVDAKSNQDHSAPLNSITKISIIDRKKGAWYGFKRILVAGTGVGLIGALSASDQKFFPPRYVFGGFTLLGGFYGLAVGAPVGALYGYRDVYIITEVTPLNDTMIQDP